MALQFNLFPPQPQTSFFPNGKRDSTANSLYQLRTTNKEIANQYQLIKASGDSFWSGAGATATLQAGSKQISTPQLFQRIGSSQTYNDGTGSRLLRLKTIAVGNARRL